MMIAGTSTVEIKPICGEFLNTGKCFINKCQQSHKMDKRLLPTNLPEKGKPVNTEAMLSSDETRKRPGGSLDQNNPPERAGESLPPNLAGLCKPYHCGICKVGLNSLLISTAHYAGVPHANNVDWEWQIFNNGGKIPNKKKKLDNKLLKSGKTKKTKEINSFRCDVCKLNLEGEETFKKHIFGIPHKKKLDNVKKLEGKLDSVKKVKPMQSFSCEVCKIDLSSAVTLEAHLKGKSHQKKKKKNSLSCDVCDIAVSSEETLRVHILGKLHKKKLQKVGKEQNAVSSSGTLITSDPTVQNLGNHAGVAETVSAIPSPVSATASASSVNKAGTEKNSISALNELALQNGYLLKWTLVSQPGPSFTMQLQIGEHTSRGTGFSKKLAKNSAAEQMMNILPAELQSTKSKKIKQKTDFSCELCGLASLTSTTLQAHLIGKTHLKNQRKKGYSTQNTIQQIVPETNLDMEVVKPVAFELKGPSSDAGSMSQQPDVRMNETTSETAVFKDEIKDVPDLTDSVMCNLTGPNNLIKNNELKITLKDNKLLHPAEIDKLASKTSEKKDIVFSTKNTEVKKSAIGVDESEYAASSDDDLVILENPDNLSSKKLMESTRNQIKVESVKLCVYPVGQSESVSVSTQDYATLAFDTFLNDIIIDFYLLYLANNVLSNSDKEKVHIFSTMFYKRLMQSPKADAKKVPEYENDATLTSAEKRHFRVASWTKNVDLFEKDMLIIPICEESHWYLLLVVKPGIIFFPFEMKEKGDPFMIVFDSVGGRKNMAVKNIRRYLACEWNKKKCNGAETLVRLEQMGKKMNTLRPNKPEQENNSDCGIFLLQYVDKVFQNVSAFMWPFLVNSRTREWFTSEEVAGKRGEIAQLIKRLTKDQKPGEVIEYPDIKFTEKGV